MSRWEFYPPHGHPDHDCRKATRLFAESQGVSPEVVHTALHVAAHVCHEEGLDVDGLALELNVTQLHIVRGAAAEDWNRDDPRYRAHLFDKMRQQAQKAQGRRQAARWN